MPTMIDKQCQCCKKPFKIRISDHNRGWGKFCSKICKAIHQERCTGQYAQHKYGDRKGVSRKTRQQDQREYGGTPQYDRNGNYVGFTMNPSELANGGYGDADWNTPFADGKG